MVELNELVPALYRETDLTVREISNLPTVEISRQMVLQLIHGGD